jgi:hypothetical protein
MAQDLIEDAEAKAAFDADPDAFLAARGFDGLSPADVTDAVGFVADTLPAEAATKLTDADADAEGLTRLAQLDPGELDPEGVEPEAPPAFLEHDPSGELDLPEEEQPEAEPEAAEEDPMAAPTASDDDLEADAAATEAAEENGSFGRVDETEPEPGFGVGWQPGDADDVTAASPEFANVLDHPADLEMDVTHVPDLAFESTDPINEAIGWADHEETAAHDTAPLEHGGADDGAAEHHHDADGDGHVDL